MIVTEFWAECVCGARERTEAPDTYPPAWPVMIDGDGKHYACTRGCLIQLMTEPVIGRPQIIAPLPLGMKPDDVRVLELVCLGYGNLPIALRMNVAESTIKNRLCRIGHALGGQTRTQVLLLAHAHGLINLPRLAQEYATGHAA